VWAKQKFRRAELLERQKALADRLSQQRTRERDEVDVRLAVLQAHNEERSFGKLAKAAEETRTETPQDAGMPVGELRSYGHARTAALGKDLEAESTKERAVETPALFAINMATAADVKRGNTHKRGTHVAGYPRGESESTSNADVDTEQGSQVQIQPLQDRTSHFGDSDGRHGNTWGVHNEQTDASGVGTVGDINSTPPIPVARPLSWGGTGMIEARVREGYTVVKESASGTEFHGGCAMGKQSATSGDSIARLEAALAQLRDDVETSHEARGRLGYDQKDRPIRSIGRSPELPELPEYPPEYDLDAAYGRDCGEEEYCEGYTTGQRSKGEEADAEDGRVGVGKKPLEEETEVDVEDDYSNINMPKRAPISAIDSGPGANHGRPFDFHDHHQPTTRDITGVKIPSKEETLDLIAVMEERVRNKHAELIGVEAPAMSTWSMQRAVVWACGT